MSLPSRGCYNRLFISRPITYKKRITHGRFFIESQASQLHTPIELSSQIIAFKNDSYCYVFAKPAYEASVWLVLKRQGMTGATYIDSFELRGLSQALGVKNLRKLLDFINYKGQGYDHHLTDRQVREVFSSSVLNHRFKVYKLPVEDAPRLAYLHDAYYASPSAEPMLMYRPEILLRHQLADELAMELLERWTLKVRQDREHWKRNAFVREALEFVDTKTIQYKIAWDLLVDLKDMAVMVVDIAGNVVKMHIELSARPAKCYGTRPTAILKR